MLKNSLKIIVLLIWAGLMGWWWHESRTWPVPEKIDAAFLPDSLEYYSLNYGSQKIGWASKNLRRLPEGGYQGGQSLTAELMVQDRKIQISSSVQAIFDRTMNLLEFSLIVQAGPLTVVERGLVRDEFLNLEVSLGDYGPLLVDFLEQYGHLLGDYARHLDFQRPVSLKAPAGPVLTQFLPSYLSYLGLTRNGNYALTVLEPFSRGLRPLAVRLEGQAPVYDPEIGREQPGFRVRLGEGPVGARLLIDRYGRVFEEEGGGFRLERVDEIWQAQAEISPLVPPPALAGLLNSKELKRIIDRAREAAESPAFNGGKAE
ncbi:MAG: hypothetical protein LBP33_09150 [Candidatus Adiutrix sp.]|jgi:hypothetical protein|nr:hypothetical protein [Candidatus Adiutrix sp.]